nr:RNA-directed DNA polymerase, eukaryota, reverse transcriptase zinc-binding domain protein [Tanacetum cinerariifolium]
IKGSLDVLVDESQNAFIPSRRISDNVLLTQELMRNYHRNRGPAKADVHSVLILSKALKEFSGVSGLVPNLSKSSVFFAHCSSLIDKVKSRLFNWKNKSLSFAGRLQLIKSVVISTQVYWASSFILPKAVNAEIEQLMRGFLWSHGLSLDCKVCDIVERDRVLWKSNNGKIGDFSVSNVWADLAEEKPMVAWHKINVWQENVVTKCSLCEVGSESHNHLFFECPYSLEVWQQFKDVVKLVIGSMVYFIWLERNLRRFQDKRRPVKDLCGIIRGNVWLRLMSLKIKKSVQVMEAARLWDFGVEECNGESGSLDSHLKFSFGSSVENNEDCALSKAYEHNDFVNGNDGYFICVSCDKSLLLDDQCKPVAKSSGLMNGLDPTCMGDVGPSDRGKLASMEDVVGTGLVSSSPMDGIASDKGGDKFEFGKISSSKGILNKPNKPMFTLNFGPNVKMSNPFMEKPIGSSAWNAWGSNAGSSFGPTILSNQFSVDAERFVEKLKKGLEEVALKMKYVPSAVSKMENGNKRIMFSAEEEITKTNSGIFSFKFKSEEGMKSVLESGPYQWKPPLCTHCKTFGHTILACKLRPKTDVERAAKIVKDASSLKGPLEENYNAMKSDEEGFFQVGKNNKSSNKGNGKGRLSKSCHSSGIVRPSQQCDSNQGNSSFGYGKYGNQQRYSYDKQVNSQNSKWGNVGSKGKSNHAGSRGKQDLWQSLWKSLQKYKQSFRNSPWVILGDFNATLDPSDKSSGCSKVTTAMSDFRDCVADIEVEDISISGLNFTWNKCPGKAGGLLKKLDRIMGNVDFITSFPTSYARFLPFM